MAQQSWHLPTMRCLGSSEMSLKCLYSGSSACTAMILSSRSPWSSICITPMGLARKKQPGCTDSCVNRRGYWNATMCLLHVHQSSRVHGNQMWHKYDYPHMHTIKHTATGYCEQAHKVVCAPTSRPACLLRDPQCTPHIKNQHTCMSTKMSRGSPSSQYVCVCKQPESSYNHHPTPPSQIETPNKNTYLSQKAVVGRVHHR